MEKLLTTNKSTILVVDDESRNRALFEAMLKPEGYTVLTAVSAEAALEMLLYTRVDLILLDVMMPGMDGNQLTGRLKANEKTKNIPVIVITSLNDRNAKLVALNSGAEEFLTKPVDRAELWVRVRNLLRLKEFNDFLEDHNRILEQKAREKSSELSDIVIQTIVTLIHINQRKNGETASHIRRIGHYSECLAEQLGMNLTFCNTLFYASQMHDIGKVSVPDRIMLKTETLSEDEQIIMRGHCVAGAEILANYQSPVIQLGAAIALNHHELWDGSGYPGNLSGEAIPLPARIVTICDTYDALRSKNNFKPAMDHDIAVRAIIDGDNMIKPQHFDPMVLNAFKACASQFQKIYQEHKD